MDNSNFGRTKHNHICYRLSNHHQDCFLRNKLVLNAMIGKRWLFLDADHWKKHLRIKNCILWNFSGTLCGLEKIYIWKEKYYQESLLFDFRGVKIMS